MRIIRFVFWKHHNEEPHRECMNIREYEYGLTKGKKFPAELQDAFEAMVETNEREDESCEMFVYNVNIPELGLNRGLILLDGTIYGQDKDGYRID